MRIATHPARQTKYAALGLALLIGSFSMYASTETADASERSVAENVTYVPVVWNMTDYLTGEPVVGAEVYALGSGKNWGGKFSDEQGQYREMLPPGSYNIHTFAGGYYPQALGDPPAVSSAGSVEVTAAGANVFNTPLIPDTMPWVGTRSSSISWNHERNEPFESMVLALNYDAYAALPFDWPEDRFSVELTDRNGFVLLRDEEWAGSGGGGANGIHFGSTDGCGYFGANENKAAKADMRSVTMTVALSSDPTLTRVVPMTQDRSACLKTKVDAYRNFVDRRQRLAQYQFHVLDRIPNNRGAPGKLRVSVQNRHLSFKIVSGLQWKTRNIFRVLRPGRNVVKLKFLPDNPKQATISSATIRVRL